MAVNNTDILNQSVITPERLRAVEDLLAQMKEDASKAHADGDVFMLSVYTDLLAVMSPIVVRAHARIEREQRAAFNKAHKTLKAAARAERERTSQNGGK